MWVNNSGDYVTNTEFVWSIPDAPRPSEIEHIWKVDPAVNGGYPYINLFLDLLRLDIRPVRQLPYICVFAMRTPKEQFTSNGLAILTPTSCEVSEDINAMFCVNLEHPIDAEHRYELLKIGNILKVNEQLFTIKRVETQYTGNSGKVLCYAEHIFYQLNDGWIYPVTYLYGGSGQGAISNITSHTEYERRDGAWIYGYDGHSDLTFEAPFRKEVDAGCTPVEALIGSGGLIEKKGGELYRDNFYYSINSRMENARNKAFDIRVGKNLQGIKRNVDMSSMVTYFRAIEPETGAWWAVAWDFGAWFGDVFPHYVVRSQNFSAPSDDPNFDWDTWFSETLVEEGMAFFRKNGKPIIGYEINLEDVRQNPDFSMTADESFRVGDIGTVYDERLGGALEIEITGTVYDALRGKVMSVTIGDKQSFVSTSMPNITFDVVPREFQTPIFDADGAIILDADGKVIVQGGVVNG